MLIRLTVPTYAFTSTCILGRRTHISLPLSCVIALSGMCGIFGRSQGWNELRTTQDGCQ